MNKPIIGITSYQNGSSLCLSSFYIAAVTAAGGTPLILPFPAGEEQLTTYSSLCDGIIFSGGADVDPHYYGEEKALDSVEVDLERDKFEMALFESFRKTEKPILGICRGMQLLNVALGGSLYQHIEGHRQSEGRDVTPQHTKVDENSFLYSIVGQKELQTNSFHHQAVKTPAPGAFVCAYADDGTVEAFEYPDYPFLLAVQWHPEGFFRKDPTAKAIFDAFVSECRY